MSAGAPISPRVVPLTAATPIVGGGRVAGAVLDIAGGATSAIAYNAFRVTNADVRRSITSAAGRGVVVAGMIDADAVGGRTQRRLEGAGDVTRYVGAPGKQHSKAIVADGSRGMVATDLADDAGLDRVEYGVLVSGPAAQALDGLVRVTPATPRAQAATRIAAAASHGIALNEPALGHIGLSAAVDDAIGGATRSLLVLTKELSSRGSADRIADAARRGVDVLVASEAMPKSIRRSLKDAGVDVRRMDEAPKGTPGMHGTLIAADGQTLVGSIYLKDEVLVPGAERRSREMGVLLGGEPAQRMRAAALEAFDIRDR